MTERLPTIVPCPHGVYPGSPAAPCGVCSRDSEISILRARVAELETGWADVLLSLGAIRKNALSQIDGMNSMGVPDDAPERKAALWYYTEANAALMR